MIGEIQTTAELETEIAGLERLQREDERRRDKHALAIEVYAERMTDRASEILKLKRIVSRRKREDETARKEWLSSRPPIPEMREAVRMEID